MPPKVLATKEQVAQGVSTRIKRAAKRGESVQVWSGVRRSSNRGNGKNGDLMRRY